MINIIFTLIVLIPAGYFLYKWARKEWEKEEEKQKELDELEDIVNKLETTDELLGNLKGVAKTKSVEKEKETN